MTINCEVIKYYNLWHVPILSVHIAQQICLLFYKTIYNINKVMLSKECFLLN